MAAIQNSLLFFYVLNYFMNSVKNPYFCTNQTRLNERSYLIGLSKIKVLWENGLHKLKDILYFPKLEGPISNRMKFQGKEVITWSINDYLGLANLPEIKKVDGEAAAGIWCGISYGSQNDERTYRFSRTIGKGIGRFCQQRIRLSI